MRQKPLLLCENIKVWMIFLPLRWEASSLCWKTFRTVPGVSYLHIIYLSDCWSIKPVNLGIRDLCELCEWSCSFLQKGLWYIYWHSNDVHSICLYLCLQINLLSLQNLLNNLLDFRYFHPFEWILHIQEETSTLLWSQDTVQGPECPRWINGLNLQVCKWFVILTDCILQTWLWVLWHDDVIEVYIIWSVTSLTILRFPSSKGAKWRQRKAELQSSLLSVDFNLFIPGMIWLWLRPVPMPSVCVSLSSLRGVMWG